jgi:hypothetical protein
MLTSWRPLLLFAIVATVIIALLRHAPIPQDPHYHSFADARTLLGVPNFWNVASNLPFFGAGVSGLLWLRARFADPIYRTLRWHYLSLFLAMMLICVGSAYYHLAPDNHRLVWDRLPMTIGFISIFCSIVSERIDERLGLRALPPLLLCGLLSVYYWDYTESLGRGDLRPYLLVQFLPMLLIPLLLLLYAPKFDRGYDVFICVGIYGAAKIFERFDRQIFELGRLLSGHTLKHLAAAYAIFWLVRMLKARRLV